MNPPGETPFCQGIDDVRAIRLAPIFDQVRAAIRVCSRYVPGGKPNADDMRGIFIRVARENSVTPDDLARWWKMWGKEPGRG